MSVLKLALLIDLQQEGRGISSFHNVLSYINCFIKMLRSSEYKYVVMVPFTIDIMFLLFTCMHSWMRGILRRWSACAPTAYELV
jgi:hypothetical protein